MGKIILSNESEKDLVSIFEFGIYRFGLLQSERYLIEMEHAFSLLSNSPYMGIGFSELYPNLRKFIFKSHLIFYLKIEEGIYIVRVLHHSKDYDKEFLDLQNI